MHVSFTLSTTLPVHAQQLYDAWLNGKTHSQLIGGAAEAVAQVGSLFTTWDSTDIANVHAIAGSCYPDGGRAVWQARAICRYQFFIWYEEEDCVTPERSISALSSEVAQPSFILIQPNPTGDVTCILLQESWPSEVTDISVVNQMGQEVWRQRVLPTPGKCTQLPSNNWAPGAYYVRAQSGAYVETEKLIINR